MSGIVVLLDFRHNANVCLTWFLNLAGIVVLLNFRYNANVCLTWFLNLAGIVMLIYVWQLLINLSEIVNVNANVSLTWCLWMSNMICKFVRNSVLLADFSHVENREYKRDLSAYLFNIALKTFLRSAQITLTSFGFTAFKKKKITIDFCRFWVLIRFFNPATTANDLWLRRIFYTRFYPLHLFFYLNPWERASIFPFECSLQW